MALHVYVADEDERPRWRVERLVVEREGGPSREHDVHLFVPERALRVLLDDVVACSRRDVRVDSERADVERSSHRSPQERAVHDRDRLDVVQADALPTLCHARNLASRAHRDRPRVHEIALVREEPRMARLEDELLAIAATRARRGRCRRRSDVSSRGTRPSRTGARPRSVSPGSSRSMSENGAPYVVRCPATYTSLPSPGMNVSVWRPGPRRRSLELVPLTTTRLKPRRGTRRRAIASPSSLASRNRFASPETSSCRGFGFGFGFGCGSTGRATGSARGLGSQLSN